MSPVYWVYLVMAVTILFNVLKALSRFRLWRIDSAREKLETALKELVDRGLTHAQMRSAPADGAVAAPEQRTVDRSIMELRVCGALCLPGLGLNWRALVRAGVVELVVMDQKTRWLSPLCVLACLCYSFAGLAAMSVVRTFAPQRIDAVVESRMSAVAWAMRQRSVSHPRSSVGSKTGAPV
jgi:hypothetical protein